MQKSKFDSQKHHRRSIRVQGFDYSSEGAYYVTIVTYQRDCLFGEIRDEKMHLNDLGKIADECWRAISEHFLFVELGAYVIMPNHVHGIIIIRRGTIYHVGAIVGSFKSAVTNRIGRELNATGIWQRNYYEHIIRNEKDLQNKTDYIEANPSLWDEDENNPRNNPLR